MYMHMYVYNTWDMGIENVVYAHLHIMECIPCSAFLIANFNASCIAYEVKTYCIHVQDLKDHLSTCKYARCPHHKYKWVWFHYVMVEALYTPTCTLLRFTAGACTCIAVSNSYERDKHLSSISLFLQPLDWQCNTYSTHECSNNL